MPAGMSVCVCESERYECQQISLKHLYMFWFISMGLVLLTFLIFDNWQLQCFKYICAFLSQILIEKNQSITKLQITKLFLMYFVKTIYKLFLAVVSTTIIHKHGYIDKGLSLTDPFYWFLFSGNITTYITSNPHLKVDD